MSFRSCVYQLSRITTSIISDRSGTPVLEYRVLPVVVASTCMSYTEWPWSTKVFHPGHNSFESRCLKSEGVSRMTTRRDKENCQASLQIYRHSFVWGCEKRTGIHPSIGCMHTYLFWSSMFHFTTSTTCTRYL